MNARQRRHEAIVRGYLPLDQCDYVVSAPDGGILGCQGNRNEEHEHRTGYQMARKPKARWRRLPTRHPKREAAPETRTLSPEQQAAYFGWPLKEREGS